MENTPYSFLATSGGQELKESQCPYVCPAQPFVELSILIIISNPSPSPPRPNPSPKPIAVPILKGLIGLALSHHIADCSFHPLTQTAHFHHLNPISPGTFMAPKTYWKEIGPVHLESLRGREQCAAVAPEKVSLISRKILISLELGPFYTLGLT